MKEFKINPLENIHISMKCISMEESWNQDYRNTKSSGIAAFHCMVTKISEQEPKMYLSYINIHVSVSLLIYSLSMFMYTYNKTGRETAVDPLKFKEKDISLTKNYYITINIQKTAPFINLHLNYSRF